MRHRCKCDCCQCRGEKVKDRVETFKKIIWICLFNGLAWGWCSYILAFLNKAVIAESLSQAAVTEIIAVILVYAIKSLTENLSKHNKWPDKYEKEEILNEQDQLEAEIDES